MRIKYKIAFIVGFLTILLLCGSLGCSHALVSNKHNERIIPATTSDIDKGSKKVRLIVRCPSDTVQNDDETNTKPVKEITVEPKQKEPKTMVIRITRTPDGRLVAVKVEEEK